MCGIFGLVYYGTKQINTALLMEVLAINSMHRGFDATGFAWSQKGNLVIAKSPGPATTFNYAKLKDSRVMIGHTRLATSGSAKVNANNHPFAGHTEDGTDYALAHNGIIYTPQIEKCEVETDTYVAVQILNQAPTLSMKTVGEMCEEIYGSFLFTILHDGGIFLARHTSPCTVATIQDLSLWVYASEKEILEDVFGEFENFDGLKIEYTTMKDNEIFHISNDGVLDKIEFEPDDYFFRRGIGYKGMCGVGVHQDYGEILAMDDIREIVTMYEFGGVTAKDAMNQIEDIIWDRYRNL